VPAILSVIYDDRKIKSAGRFCIFSQHDALHKQAIGTPGNIAV